MEVILKRSSIFLSAAILSVLLLSHLCGCGKADNLNTVELPDEAVSEDILENGLVLLVKEIPSQDLAAINVKVLAGSALEGEYLGSGISHLAEHMLFKGTASRGPGVIEKEVKSLGGFINGSVGQDVTEYSIIVPVKNVHQAISLLKDMLLNASFAEEELEKEKEVILKELHLTNDEPQNLLFRILNKTAYIRHVYKYPPIGNEERFKSLRREDLIDYYNKMYAPNRMVMAIVGGVGRNTVLPVVEEEFEDFRPANYAVQDLSPAEPAQIDKRYAQKGIETNLAYLAIGYHSTSVLSEDLFAMDVLSMILGRGDNSKLNSSLLKKDNLVYSIACWNFTPRDPGLFVITATLDPAKLSEVERRIQTEVNRIRSGNVSAEELKSAKNMVLGDYLMSMQTVDAQANNLAFNYMLTGSSDFSRRYVVGIDRVSVKDLKRVAGKYLSGDGATVVAIVPDKLIASKDMVVPAPVKEQPAKIVKLTNGLRLIVRQNKNTPTISMTVAIGGGLASENNKNNGISNFTARMLLKGTGARKESQIKGAVEAMGGNIDTFSGFDGFGVTLGSLKSSADASLSLLRDIITDPVFPQEEIEMERRLITAMIYEENEDVFQRGIDALREEVFADSQYRLPFLGSEESIKNITRGDLVKYYKSHAVPGNMIVSISGDFEPDEMAGKLTKAFNTLKSRNVPAVNFSHKPSDDITVKIIAMDKEQSFAALGFATVSIKSPDRYALEVLGSVLSGYSGRLFDSLRNKLPLSYALGCVQKQTPYSGLFALYAATTKENIRLAEEGLVLQMMNLRSEGITEEELVSAKRELSTDHAMDMQTNEYFSQTTAIDELYGLGYDNILRYDKEISKVTVEDVKRVVNKYFDPGAYSEVIISSET
ncbi:MAG: pitrilysin family protein [Candidatus Omnitrophota bacterium]